MNTMRIVVVLEGRQLSPQIDRIPEENTIEIVQSEPKTIGRYFGFLTKIKTFTASPDRLIIVVLTMDILLASVAETKGE